MPEPSASIPPVLLVGCGRMGSALLRGWRLQGLQSSIVLDPGDLEIEPPHLAVRAAHEIDQNFSPAAIVFAVKPQVAETALPPIAPFAANNLVLSIMAGRTIEGLARYFPPGTAIVRAMPNTPAAIGAGVSVACAGSHITPEHRALATRLLAAAGEVAWIEDEALLDPVTAISGSGPAYLFLLAELLEQAGLEQGLPAPLARLLARGTVSGSARLLDASPEQPASALRREVTSPGGTTEKALAVMMAPAAWPATVRAAIQAATQRSRELAR